MYQHYVYSLASFPAAKLSRPSGETTHSAWERGYTIAAVHDVVTDWSYALAGFLVSTLLVVPPANPSNFANVFMPRGVAAQGIR